MTYYVKLAKLRKALVSARADIDHVRRAYKLPESANLELAETQYNIGCAIEIADKEEK